MEDILLQVKRPGQYIGEEWNVSRKDFDGSEIKFALCFPDLYEIGMSNLGVRIIYGLLNSIPDICCERFFSPGIDFEQVLRRGNREITSLESKKRLRDFDIVGFSLGYELGYTNVLNILDLGGLPLKAAQRSHEFPLVIAGGPCTVNPEPMHEFFDLFIIGEAEEVLLELIEVFRKLKQRFKSGEISKRDLLMAFAQIEGVYVPSFYELNYDEQGRLREFKPAVKEAKQLVKKRFISDLNSAYFPLEWLVPYVQIVHDRITVEIMRGCPNQCRFCQARTQYHPFRCRDKQSVLGLAEEVYRRTGYEEISLVGLSASDHPCIKEILKSLISAFETKKISVSLPSIKPKLIVTELASLISGIKKTGLTFAPEAGTERMRKIINKNFDQEEFFQVLEQAYLCGYQHIKLYFMTGFPTEAEEDLDGIIALANEASQIRRKTNKGPAQVNVSINTLVPKPHTAFQWLKMQDLEVTKFKEKYLKSKAKNRKIKLSFHNPQMSFMEGIFSRGDRRLSSVIEQAFLSGARMDGWQDCFVYDKWIEAFARAKIEPQTYLREKSVQEALPWDFLDMGIDKEALKNDFNKVIAR